VSTQSTGSELAGGRLFCVEGMSCDGCVQSVTTALKKLPGVKGVQVSLEQKRATVVADEAALPNDKIESAITALGFQAKALPAK